MSWQHAIDELRALPKFQPAISDPAFEPGHRKKILDGMLPVPDTLRIDADALMDLAAFHVSLTIKDADYYVGVIRKGMSFLHELNFRLKLPDAKLVSNEDLGKLDLKGKNVVIVDDAIHTGATVLALVERIEAKGAALVRANVLLASTTGLDKLKEQRPKVEVNAVFPVPEELYGPTYQGSLVRVMEHYKRGSLSNRPTCMVEAQGAKFAAPKACSDAIRALASWPMAEVLNELPPFHGAYPPIFRATSEFNEAAVQKIRELSGGHDVEQAKIRVFAGCNGSLRLQLYAIYYPHIPTSVSTAERDAIDTAVCKYMLETANTHLREQLLAMGYAVS